MRLCSLHQRELELLIGRVSEGNGLGQIGELPGNLHEGAEKGQENDQSVRPV